MPPRPPRALRPITLAPGDQLTDELGRLIPRARHTLWRRAAARLEAVGESMFAWPLLRRVMEHGGLSQRELAQLTAQHPAAVSRTLDELETRHLVRRTRDRRDRRRVLVALTPRGRTRCAAVVPVLLVAVGEALAPLTLPERRVLCTLLRKIVGPLAHELASGTAGGAPAAARRGPRRAAAATGRR